MSILQTEFPLQFPDYSEHLTAEQLNEAYWERGLSYPSIGHAKAALKTMGFTPTKYKLVWKKNKQYAYITRLREANLQHKSNYWHKSLKRSIEVYVAESYYSIGALITFSGNVPYLKV